jgi:hypothetical protein
MLQTNYLQFTSRKSWSSCRKVRWLLTVDVLITELRVTKSFLTG